MTPERWQEVKRVLAAVLERTPEERTAYLDKSCAEPELRREVESLLRAEDEARSSFLTPLQITSRSGLTRGERVGVYEILDRIGAGGMGEVYHARDTNLGRSVAIKVLPSAFLEDDERLARFQREARVLASLNHPNIATIHGVEQSDGRECLVMELIPGETLAERLKSGRMDMAEALGIAQQVAAALESAHEQGIVHRDLSPANVKVMPDGRVKVLDFGLAKAFVTGNGERTAAPFAESKPGTILGTPAYMSPEQVRGKTVDKRADIWAFGCVLYEMASGRRAFQGETVTDVLAAVLTDEPDWSAVPRITPIGIQRLIRRCLAKDPQQRLRDIGDARIALDEVRGGEEQTALPISAVQTSPAKGRMRRWAPLLGLAALTAAMVLAFVFRPAIPPPRVVASTQVTKDGRGKDSMATDGSRIYFSVTSGYLFSLHEVSLTGGAEAPIETSIESPTVEDISPDHSELLIGNCKIPIELQCPLFALPVLGQSARRLGGIEADGATWSHDGKEIVYANGHSVYRMRADGSEPVKIVSVAEGGGYPSWPRWAPDGRRLRFTVSTGHGRESLWEVAADGSNLHPVLPGWSDPPTECCGSWTPNGKYFVFTSGRGGAQNLWAIREAPSMFYKASKEPVQLTIGPTPNSLPLVSPDGKKVFVATAQTRGEMVRYSSASHQFLPYLSGISAICVNFSPDGKWVAYSSYPDTTLWRSKIDGSEAVQLTFPPMTVLQPRWSPDGTRIAFMGSEPGKAFKVYVVPSSGGRVEEAMPGNHFGADPNWSPDGNELLIGRYASEVAPGEPLNLQILNLRTHEMSKVPGSDDLWSPRWSGDGRYILAVRRDGGWLMLYDTATQKWSPLVKMVVDWPEWSRKADYIYFYGAEAGGGQGLFRVRVSDRKVELVFALRDFRQPPDIGWGSWKGLAPDESPILLRDAGVQDIYALDVDFP